MTVSTDIQGSGEIFAHSVQVLGGATAAARRLGIDERAIRRFINGERPISANLLADTATALRLLVTEATAAEGQIAKSLAPAPNDT